MFDVAVLIGRMQPFHIGHAALAEFALTKARRLVIVLGSIDSARTIRNPWFFEERKAMICSALAGLPVTVVGVSDSAFDLAEWTNAVVHELALVTGKDEQIVLVGHTKDESSFYLRQFPEWAYVESGLLENGIAATGLRFRYFAPDISWPAELVPEAVALWLEKWKTTQGYAYMVGEYAFAMAEQESESPRALQEEELFLLVSRGFCVLQRPSNPPGRNLLRIPGMMKGVDDSKVAAGTALRSYVLEACGLEGGAVRRIEFRGGREFSLAGPSGHGKQIGRLSVHIYNDKSEPGIDVRGEFTLFPVSDIASGSRIFYEEHGRMLRFCFNQGWLG